MAAPAFDNPVGGLIPPAIIMRFCILETDSQPIPGRLNAMLPSPRRPPCSRRCSVRCAYRWLLILIFIQPAVHSYRIGCPNIRHADVPYSTSTVMQSRQPPIQDEPISIFTSERKPSLDSTKECSIVLSVQRKQCE